MSDMLSDRARQAVPEAVPLAVTAIARHRACDDHRELAPASLVAARAARRAGFRGRSRARREAIGYDLHALIELVERGCPPELAVRILAPLDEEIAA